MTMSEDRIDLIADNEKEWRKYMLRKIDKLEDDFNIFKFKAYGFIAVLVGFTKAVEVFFNK